MEKINHPTHLPAGRKELMFSLPLLICGMMLYNFTINGGLQLGFALAMFAYLLWATEYLLISGCKLTPYSGCLLGLSLVIIAGYGRSADTFVKFILLFPLVLSINLGFCLLAGQHRHSPGGAGSIADVFYSIFNLGFGELGNAIGGLFNTATKQSTAFKKLGAVGLGLLVMIPVLAILLPLMIQSDAAFEGMMELFPEIEITEIIFTLLMGTAVFCVLYSRCVALVHCHKEEPVPSGNRKGIHKLTINTVLVGVGSVYCLYLLSQLAYFVGGFSGILPQEYTLAEYARRGFFEMAILCGLNMGIVVLAVALVRKSGSRTPLSTRLLCLFIGLFTLFLVTASSAKMINYINGYGLTRLRLMTQLIIVFFGIAAITVSANLFMKKPRYMPVLIIAALVIGGTTLWADVDTVVAAYNVNAYQTGKLATVDVEYLSTLSNGAIPHIAKLTQDKKPEVARQALEIMKYQYTGCEDFRSWNYADFRAKEFISNK